MVPLHGSRAPWAVVAAIVLGTSCGGGGDGGVAPRVATSIQASSTTSQDGPAGGNVAQPPAVLVRDQDNVPMSGVSVSFQVTAGNGAATPATVTTGGNGVAQLSSWTLGGAPGTNVLTATAAGLPAVTFNATGVRAAISVQATTATTQEAPVGTNVGDPPAVIVRDGQGLAMEGVTVSFAVTGGGGSVTPVSVVTDADGIAQATSWTLGPGAGQNTLTATVAGLTPVAFGATGFLLPASVAANSSTSQAALAGSAVAEPPAVIVRTATNLPVSGVTVTFQVTAGGGTVIPTSVVTGADGIARVTSWTLGTTPGANSVSATVTGLQPVNFSASGTAPLVATTVTAVSVTTQTAPASSAVSAPPSVIVRDQNNNPMQGVTVAFAVTAGGGTVLPATSVTGANGIATATSWTLGAAPVQNTVTATVSGLPAVQFDATGILIPVSIQATTATSQQGVVNTTVTTQPAVIVRDQHNNPLQGAVVTFAITAGGGTVIPTSGPTGADGIASVIDWTLGPASGTNTLTATVNGLAPVVFTAIAVDPCEAANINLGAVINGSLASGACQLVTGEFVVFYKFTIADTRGVRIRQSSAAFDTYVLLLDADGDVIAENDDISTPTNLNSELFALLPAGTYIVGATSFDVGETGAFELRVEETSASVTNCTPYFTVRGISTAQSLSNTDCEDSGFFSDTWVVFLEAGQQVTIDMLSSQVDAFLFLFDADFNFISQNDDRDGGTTDARIVYTPTLSGYYIISASSAGAGESGSYTLGVQ